ncbi:outer membrane beta-barrel protein [Hymenobacter sp. HMF4947]|uniref:Outer membrane beta-barrel protein n=1 Tax=Hymenobacter ginkgonis TaxID=2682976 RepID=A0A7K1TBM6_9BACT|nr:outer membrane beta-barrel protein [Hymenobacter ginkgonis]MVN75789.1 outer membrane beta-barrel protein [Hymenobacter ginkgonis]
MKPTLFSAAFVALVGAAATAAPARALPPAPTDTIVVRLPNKATMTLVVRDARQLRELPQYHLDSLVARLGGYIRRADDAAKSAKTDRVTTQFFPNQDNPGQGLPEEVRITTHKAKAGYSGAYGPSNKVEVLLEKKFGVVVNIDGKSNDQPRAAASRADRQAERDSMRQARWDRKSSSTDFIFDLGLNALTNKGGANQPELRTFGSRYVNLGFNYKQRLGGRRSPLYLVGGPEFAFNNYMLEGNNKWVNVNGLTAVISETSGRQYQKTKLATSTFTVPLMFQLNLRDDHQHHTLTLGAGGFVGYRLGSWTKLKYFEEGSTYKDKDYGSYNLTDWQYGLQGVLGYKSLTFFAKYNLNDLFRDGHGPQAQTLSFGVRFFGN